MKNFKDPSQVVIAVGDFQQNNHVKFKAPVKGKGFRTMFEKNGYDIYLIDEFKTSCMYCKCGEGKCKNNLKRPDPRPCKKGTIQRIHELLRCKNDKCRSYWILTSQKNSFN